MLTLFFLISVSFVQYVCLVSITALSEFELLVESVLTHSFVLHFFLFQKTDRARSMGETPNGSIPVAEIRAVSIPQDHKDGCRLDLETTSRRVFELQAGSASDCQRWLNLLTIQCRQLGTLADLSDEKAVDEQHEKDLALMLMQNAQRGGEKAGVEKDASGNILQPLGPEPDFTEDELIAVEPEVIRDVEQYTISVSLDLQGFNADKVSPFVVVFGPGAATTNAAASPAPVAASASSATPAASSSSSTASPPFTLPTPDSPTFYANLEIILQDPQSSANCAEIAQSFKPSLMPILNLYGEIRSFRLCHSSATQSTAATNMWQRFLRKGAAEFVPFPGTLRLVEGVHDALKKRRITMGTFDGMLRHVLSVLRGEFWTKYVEKYPQAISLTPTVPFGPLSFNPAMLHASQRKIQGSYSSGTGVQVAYNKQGSMINGNPLRGWDELCRTETLPRLGKKGLVVGGGGGSNSNSSGNSSSSHTGSISGPSGPQTRTAKQSIIGGDMALQSRVNERRHFDVLLGVNLEVGLASKTGAERRVKKLNGLLLPDGQGSFSIAGHGPNQTARPLLSGQLTQSQAIAQAKARRASTVMNKRKSQIDMNGLPALIPSPTSSGWNSSNSSSTGGERVHRRRSSSLDASTSGGLGGPSLKIAAALAAAAQTKALDESDVSLGRVGAVLNSAEDADENTVQEEDEEDNSSSDDDEDREDHASVFPTNALGAHSRDGSALSTTTDVNTPTSASVANASASSNSNAASSIPALASHIHTQTITIDKNLKTLRFHIYHATELNNEDLSSHILLARMECSLKEVLYSENGELTRVLFMVDGYSSSLSGFIHVMFHDVRRIKVSNTPRYAYRSYIFRDVNQQDFLCHENLQESPFTFSLPHAALLRAVDHARLMRKSIMQNLSETDASITSGKNSVEEESQKSQMLSFMQRQVKAYTAVIAQWERLVKLYYNYQGCFHGLRFKPSVEKSSKSIRIYTDQLSHSKFYCHSHWSFTYSSIDSTLVSNDAIWFTGRRSRRKWCEWIRFGWWWIHS
jgi:hypothetical protein